MKARTVLSKTDIVVAGFCLVFLLASLGAVGGTGHRRAKEAVCSSNLHQWGIFWKLFADDRGGYFLPRSDAGWWIEQIAPRCSQSLPPKMWLCPEATKTFYEGARNPWIIWQYTTYTYCLYEGSYGLNLWTSNSSSNSSSQNYWRTPYVAGACYVPLFLDSMWKDMEPYPEDLPAANETDMWTPNAQEMQRGCVNRHNGVNAVYLDGSVRKVGLKHLWRLKWHRTWPADYPLPTWPAWMQNFKDP